MQIAVFPLNAEQQLYHGLIFYQDTLNFPGTNGGKGALHRDPDITV